MWNCTHFRHPTDEKLLLLDNFTHATTIYCGLFPQNYFQ